MTTARIFRYDVPVDDKTHAFDLHGDPLAVGLRMPGVVEFWAVHHDGIERWDDDRLFRVVGTGHPLPDKYKKHWGFAYDLGRNLVWHLVEVHP